jgi:hypothetical protein
MTFCSPIVVQYTSGVSKDLCSVEGPRTRTGEAKNVTWLVEGAVEASLRIREAIWPAVGDFSDWS